MKFPFFLKSAILQMEAKCFHLCSSAGERGMLGWEVSRGRLALQVPPPLQLVKVKLFDAFVLMKGVGQDMTAFQSPGHTVPTSPLKLRTYNKLVVTSSHHSQLLPGWPMSPLPHVKQGSCGPRAVLCTLAYTICKIIEALTERSVSQKHIHIKFPIEGNNTLLVNW